MEYKNNLGYSYWLEVVCGIFLTVATFLLLSATSFKYFTSPYEKGIKYADDMHSNI